MKLFIKREKYSPDEFDDIQPLNVFLDSIKNKEIHPDDGGICDIFVDGYSTNINLNSPYSLFKTQDTMVEYSFEELCALSEYSKVEINWASK